MRLLVLGVAAAVFERATPLSVLPDAATVAAFVTDQRAPLLVQSILFVLSSGAMLVFAAALRRYLHHAGLLADVVFAAGIATAVLQLLAQCTRIALGTAASRQLDRRYWWSGTTWGSLFSRWRTCPWRCSSR